MARAVSLHEADMLQSSRAQKNSLRSLTEKTRRPARRRQGARPQPLCRVGFVTWDHSAHHHDVRSVVHFVRKFSSA